MKNKPGRQGGFHLPPPVRDTLILIGQWTVVTAGIFAWWMGLQLVISLFAVNVWHVTFRQILWRSVVLTALSGAVYLAVILRRGRKSGDGAEE
ncbi:MAG: hypothetical protein IKS31_08145 [Clostridia bacterium]|nr:hypothetical protein [Clostridia bacterium]